MLLTSLALVMTLQSGAQTLTAVRNDDPETWSVEYPRLIRPYVVDYRQCLNVSNRRVTGEADFEAQHRTDIPRCAEERAKAIAESNEAMAGSKTRITSAEVDALFRDIGLIHIARGRDLDQQFTDRMAATTAAKAQYEDDKPKGLVMDLVDGSVVKSRADIQAAAEATNGATDKTKVNN